MMDDVDSTKLVLGEPDQPPNESRGLTPPMKHVEGKVAFITGGDSGIGLGIARAFVNAGMKVVITYRNRRHLGEAMEILHIEQNRVHAVSVDVVDRRAMAAAAEEAVRVFKKVHILVNNAGVWPTISLSNATFDDWDWCINVNVNGVFNGIRAFLPKIRSHHEGGHIVTTASIGGLAVPPLWGLYSTSKVAAVGMMEALRSELAGTGVGASVFCPGGVTSNIGKSDRNRPASLGETGKPDPSQKTLMDAFGKTAFAAALKNGGTQPMMDPLEAGERVLDGIRNNHLYILSHPEYEQTIRDRNEALLASIPEGGQVSQARVIIAQAARNSIYGDEVARRSNPLARR